LGGEADLTFSVLFHCHFSVDERQTEKPPGEGNGQPLVCIQGVKPDAWNAVFVVHVRSEIDLGELR
jgi:hypothetical protein